MAGSENPSIGEDPDVQEALEDLAPPPPAAKKAIRAPRLNSVADVRKAGARLFGMMLKGEMASADASRGASVLALVLRTLQSDLEDRLAKLEDRFRESTP